MVSRKYHFLISVRLSNFIAHYSESHRWFRAGTHSSRTYCPDVETWNSFFFGNSDIFFWSRVTHKNRVLNIYVILNVFLRLFQYDSPDITILLRWWDVNIIYLFRSDCQTSLYTAVSHIGDLGHVICPAFYRLSTSDRSQVTYCYGAEPCKWFSDSAVRRLHCSQQWVISVI